MGGAAGFLGGLLGVGGGNRPPEHRDETDTALEILRKRYTRGEITRDEYAKMKRDLLE